MSFVVAIGGVRSVGKSTVAKGLGLLLQADIISTGRLRKMLQVQCKGKVRQELGKSISDAQTVTKAIKRLHTQAQILRSSLVAATNQNLPRKARFILEGQHFYPGFFDDWTVNLHVILTSPRKILRERIRTDERDSEQSVNVDRVFQLQDYYVEEAEKRGLPVIDSTVPLRALGKIMGL